MAQKIQFLCQTDCVKSKGQFCSEPEKRPDEKSRLRAKDKCPDYEAPPKQ